MSSISGASASSATPLDQYKQQFESLCANVDNRLAPYPIFTKVKEAGVRPAHALLGAALFFALFALFGLGANAVCNLIGFIYPAYASFKALKSDCFEDDKHWLTYWIVYACFNVTESLTDILLHWVPFYYLFKALFLVWLYAEQTRGAERLYLNIIEPLMTRYETSVDAARADGQAAASATRSEFRQDIASGFASLKSKAINAAASIREETASTGTKAD